MHSSITCRFFQPMLLRQSVCLAWRPFAAGGPVLHGLLTLLFVWASLAAHAQGSGDGSKSGSLITTQPPAGSAVCVGSAVQISVDAGKANFQWYKNGKALPGKASKFSTLTLPTVEAGDAGSYSVVVVGSPTSVTSTVFSLTVNALPTPTLLPAMASLCGTPTGTLTAGGGISYTLSYGQPVEDVGVPVSGRQGVSDSPTEFVSPFISTTGNYTVSSAGNYVVTVSNAAGCTATATATVIDGNFMPPIASLSTSGTPGNGLMLSATATGRAFVWSDPTGKVMYSTVYRNFGFYSVSAPGGGAGQYTLTVSDGPCQTSSKVMVP